MVPLALAASRLETAANVTAPAAGLTPRFVVHAMVASAATNGAVATVHVRMVLVSVTAHVNVGDPVILHDVDAASAAQMAVEEVNVNVAPTG